MVFLPTAHLTIQFILIWGRGSVRDLFPSEGEVTDGSTRQMYRYIHTVLKTKAALHSDSEQHWHRTDVSRGKKSFPSDPKDAHQEKEQR